jgi:hypothetical protein
MASQGNAPYAGFRMDDENRGKGRIYTVGNVAVEKDGRPRVPREQRETEQASSFWQLSDCELNALDG